ncbi:MAG: hypothetical protein FWE60_04365, partial [Oscillospiraceae bacterium]|nr:hypothetical protein [Oscillospiraceae bacterium]
MKYRLKWASVGALICLGLWAAVIMPGAVQSMLPEVETVSPQKFTYSEQVRGAGVIFTRAEGGGDKFFLQAAVREGDINAVMVGQPAKLYGAAIGDGEYLATVVSLADFAEQRENGNVTETVVGVVLEIDNPNGLLRPGYTAEAVIGVNEPREFLKIPYEAIAQDDKGEFVLVLKGNTAVRRDILTGLELAGGAELLTGVRESDIIILKPENYSENTLVKESSS